MHYVTLRPRPLTLKVIAHVGNTGLRKFVGYSICTRSFKFVGLSVRKILRIYCVNIYPLVTLTIDLLTSKLVHGLQLGFLYHSVLELDRGTRQIDR